MKPCRLVLLATLLLAATAPIAAQQPYRHRFWMEMGVGTGTIRLGCATCTEPVSAYGESSYLRVGGSLSPRVVWGLELFSLLDPAFGLTASDSTVGLESVSISPVVLWYPWQGGLFVKAGVGVAHGEVLGTDSAGTTTTLTSGTGSGLTFGIGFDTPIFSWISITANLGIYFGALGDVTIQGAPFDDAVTSMYNANFAITIR